MAESTCLHIQDRESGPIRVVELPGISVRIGRAPHCEIQLTELGRAEEVCRLLRRGRSWQLVPNGKGSPIRLEGRSLSGCCLLPFDVPFFVGSYSLTLRHDRAAEPDWGTYPSKAPSQPERTATLIRPRPPDRRGVEPEEPDRPLPRAPELGCVPPALEYGAAPPHEPLPAASVEPPPELSDEGAVRAPPTISLCLRTMTRARAPIENESTTQPGGDPAPSLRERWVTRWRAPAPSSRPVHKRLAAAPSPCGRPTSPGLIPSRSSNPLFRACIRSSRPRSTRLYDP